MRQQKAEEYMSGNLTAMIDVVFQLIIFFVCTIKMQDDASEQAIKLAMAPNGMPVVVKDSREIIISVTEDGRISIARTPLSVKDLSGILRKAVSMTGTDIPVVIKADSKSQHGDVRKVMDACAGANIWKIKISALKEKAG